MDHQNSVELDLLQVALKAGSEFEVKVDHHPNENITFYRVTGLAIDEQVQVVVTSNASAKTIDGMGVEIQGLGIKKLFHLSQGRGSDPIEFSVDHDEQGLSVHVWPAKKDEELIAPTNETDKDRVLVFIFDVG